MPCSAPAHTLTRSHTVVPPRRLRLLCQAPDEPYVGPDALATVAAPPPGRAAALLEELRAKFGSHPLFSRLSGASLKDNPLMRKGAELADELRDKYETSDHPAVHKVEVRAAAGRRRGRRQSSRAAAGRQHTPGPAAAAAACRGCRLAPAADCSSSCWHHDLFRRASLQPHCHALAPSCRMPAACLLRLPPNPIPHPPTHTPRTSRRSCLA